MRLKEIQVTKYGMDWLAYEQDDQLWLSASEVGALLNLCKGNATRSIQRILPGVVLTKGMTRLHPKAVNLIPMDTLPQLLLNSAILGNPQASKILGHTRQPTRKNSRKPKLYLVGTTCGSYVKIGVSVDPQKRLKGIQTGCPISVEILRVMVVRNAYKLEKSLHARLSDYNTSGEWFDTHILALVDWDSLST